MAFDFSNISDEELEAMAAQSDPASGFGGAAPSAPQKPLSEWTDEELEAYASEPTPAPAQSAAHSPRMTRENLYSYVQTDDKGNIKSALGIPVRPTYDGEENFFRSRTDVGGMASEDGRIILNKHAGLSPDGYRSVALNEAVRQHLKKMGSRRPTFALTDEQGRFFRDELNYSNDDRDIQDTIIARILSGDSSAGAITQEQAEAANSVRDYILSQMSDKMTREERIAQNNRAIERAQQPGGGEDGFDLAVLEGVKGAARAVKDIGGGIVGMVSGAARLAGTPVRLATGWEGLHRLADTIDSSYENFGRDALMSEYGENPDGWGYALGRAGEKIAGVAGSLAALGGVGKAVGAAGTALKAAGHAKTAAAVANTLPLMFGNDAAVRAYDTARANGKSKTEAASLAGLNGAIHFLGFKAFENQSLKKMLNIGPDVEMMMPKWADALAEEGGQSFSSLVRGTRNGMVKYIAAENGKRALKAGGIMGLQNFLSDPVMQVAEGTSIDDIDFSRMLKAGAEGVGEGALMEGALGAAAVLKSPAEARKFIADKIFRGKGYKVVGPDGKPHDEPGLLNTSEGRMTLMKQNPDATERVLDIVEHGGTPRPAELDAAFLPPDMTAEELRKFASDWRTDLKPYVDEAWAADAPRQTAAPDPNLSDSPSRAGRDFLSREEAQSQQKAANAAERQKVADRRAAADSMMLDFESWNRLYADGKTDLNFDEWRAAGKPGVIEANLTPKTEEAPTSETRANEEPAQPEQAEVVAPATGAEARPVESAEARAEAADARVVETPAQPAEAAQKPAEAAVEPKVGEGTSAPAKPAEVASRASYATPERKAPAPAPEPVFENEQLEKAYRMIQSGVAKDVKAGEALAQETVGKMKGRDLDRLEGLPGNDKASRTILEIASDERSNRWISDEPLDPDGPTPDPIAEAKDAPLPSFLAPETAPAKEAPAAKPAPKSNRLKRADGTDPLAEKPMPKTLQKAVYKISSAIANRTGTGVITPDEAYGIVRGIAESPRTKHNRTRDFFGPLEKDAAWHESMGLDVESAKNIRDAFDRVKADADLKKWFPQVDSAVKKAKDGNLSRTDAVPLFGKISEGLEKAERMGLSEAANRLREAAEVIRPVAEEVTQGDVGKFNYSTKGRKLNNRLGGTDKRGGKTVSLDTKNGTVDVGADGRTLDKVIDEGADASHDRRSLKPGESYGKGFTGEERDAGGEPIEANGDGSAGAASTQKPAERNGAGVKFAGFTATIGENGNIRLTKTFDAKDEYGRDVERQKPVEISQKQFRAMAKQFGVDADAMLEKMTNGKELEARASKSAESPAERDLRFASDENYQKWLKSRNANDAEPLRERYEQEQARAAKSITKNALPGVDVEVVDRAFNPETDGGGRQLLDGEGRVVGTFDRSTNKITLYRGATAATLVHELGGHATLRFAEQEAERGNRQLLDRINRAIDEAPQALKDEIRNRYSDVDETALRDEIWAALRERNSPAMEKAIKTLQGRAWYNRAWAAFRDAWKGLLARMGFNRADLSQIDKMSNDEFLSHLDRIMSDGKTLGRLEAMGEGTRNAVVPSKPPPAAPKIDMSKDESLKEKYLRNMSDRYDPLKRLVEEAKESAAKPSDVPDPYHEKRVQSGHNEADRHQIDMLKNKYVDFLKRHSHGQKEQEKLHEEVNMYLRARDALYRNPEMKKRLGVDDGSGMSDAQAHKILDDFKRRMRTPILDQAFKIMQEVKKTYGLQRLVDGGMLDQATADMLEKRNPDYAPQRTSRLDEEGIDRNSTRNMEAAAIKKALGRSTLSDNPVEFLFLQASDAAARTNENRTRQEMAKFVRMFPEVGKVRTVDKTSAYDLKTGKDAWIEDPHDVESENPLVVSFRENGKRMRIEFADTPRGRLLAESMRNEGVNRGPEAFDRMTRAWASTATQLSATFSGRNFQKDTVEVALNSAADTGFSGAGKFLKAQIAQMKPVVSTIREYLTKGTFGGPLGKEFKEFIDAGGSIGGMGREGYEDLKDTFSRKAKGLKMAFSGAHGAKEKVEAILGVTFGKIEDFNKTIEMMSRFNNYRSRRAKGESEKEAVIGSREDSTDFNMYGQQRWLNDVYMFSNSILGGTLRSTKQLATGKNGLKVATAVLAYGFVEAAADVLFNRGDDDEAEKSGLGGAKDLSERERSQTLYFRYGGKYFRIPVHGGPFSALKYTGGLLARAALGKLSWSDAAKNAVKEWATIGTHFGGAGEIDLANGPKGIVSSFTPSVARPVAELGMNQDFAGRHIYASEGFDRTTPKSERGFKSTGDGYKWFARLMNKVGGGNESRSADWSWFDNPPEAYKHIVEAVGKNMIRDIMLGGETAGRAVESAVNWENRFTRDDVPFLRDVTRNVPDNSRRYYDALEEYERDKAEFKKTTPERRKEMKADKPYLFIGKSLLDGQIEQVKKYMHLERGEVKVGQKWVEPKTPRTEEQKEKYRKLRLEMQARVLKRLGE